jgi:hypothetical protein
MWWYHRLSYIMNAISASEMLPKHKRNNWSLTGSSFHVVVSNTFMYRQFANPSEILEILEDTVDLSHWIKLSHAVVYETFVHCEYVSEKETFSK